MDPIWREVDWEVPHRDVLTFMLVTALADGLSRFFRRRIRTAAVVTIPTEEPRIYDPYRMLEELRTAGESLPLFGFAPDSTPAPEGEIEVFQQCGLRVARNRKLDMVAGVTLLAEEPPELSTPHTFNEWLRIACQHLQAFLATSKTDETRPLPGRRWTAAQIARWIEDGALQAAGVAAARLSLAGVEASRERVNRFERPLELVARLARGLSLAREEGLRIQGTAVIPTLDPVWDTILGLDAEPTNIKLVGKLLLAAGDKQELVIPVHRLNPDFGDELTGHDPFGYRASRPPDERELRVEVVPGGEAIVSCGGQTLYVYRGGDLQGLTAAAEANVAERLLASHLDSINGNKALASALTAIHHRCPHGSSLAVVLDSPSCRAIDLGAHLDPPFSVIHSQENQERAARLASVDGAVLFGADGLVYGFCCLLDGEARPPDVMEPDAPHENRARGSRYNSAIRFTAASTNSAVLVGSADGGVSLVINGHEVYPTNQFEEPRLIGDGQYNDRVVSQSEWLE